METKKTLYGKHAEVTLIELKRKVVFDCPSSCTISHKEDCLHKKRLMIQPKSNNLTASLAKVVVRHTGNKPLSIKSNEWQGYWIFDILGRSYQSYSLCAYLHEKYFQSENFRIPGFQLKDGDFVCCYFTFQELSPNTQIDELKLIIGQEFFDFKLRTEKLSKNRKMEAIKERGNRHRFTLPKVIKDRYLSLNNNVYKELANNCVLSSNILDIKHSSLPLFHQIITAHELTLKRAAHDLKKLESPLSAAMVDLNPHQVDAALFAFKSPMSRGAILCDEVGLGKTIEAGLVISQLWAEGKRKIIAVVPAPHTSAVAK